MIKGRLEAYRRQQQSKIAKTMEIVVEDTKKEEPKSGVKETPSETPALALKPAWSRETDPNYVAALVNEDNVQLNPSKLNKIVYILYIILWVSFYILSIKLEFGSIYFILSAFAFIWLNTSLKPREEGAPSAYSVFNPNCEAIDGTLDASQFEREIRYGIGGFR